MDRAAVTSVRGTPRPSLSAAIELLKPITWFPPMWALGCGVVSSGLPILDRWPAVVGAVLLAGPLVCGTSQAVNDWFDRHVDAINEPNRPIPSGRIAGRWGLYIAIAWTALSLGVAALLGPWVLGAAVFGLVLAWAYSAPPFRLKRSGWLGPGAVGLCYEGLPWFTGAAAMALALPDSKIVMLAVLYSAGAHGIMTLNDFKSVEGDARTGLKSLPVQLGVDNAAWLACVIMAAPQVAVIVLLADWGRPVHATLVMVSLILQAVCMARMLRRPMELAPWYNATGVTLYVLGMLVSAFAVRTLVGGA